MQTTAQYQMNEEMQQWVHTMLQQGTLSVLFTKKDGSDRTLICTLAEDMITADAIPTGSGSTRKKNPEAIAVFDLENGDWRSFRWDSVKNISFSLDFE